MPCGCWGPQLVMKAVTLLPDQCHPAQGWTKGLEPLLGGGTCKAKPKRHGGLWLGLLLWGTVVAEPPHCHLSSRRIATNVARKLQEERGKGRLHCPRGAREALGSPVTPCCSTRLSPHGGDQWLSPSSLVGQGHLGLLAAAWDRIPGRGDTTPVPQPCVFSPCSAPRGPG